MEHVVVYAEEGRFAGWPANNGAWSWEGSEILVGFTTGPYEVQKGHNIGHPYTSLLARSTDGGDSWSVETPANFVGRSGTLADVSQAIDFSSPGLALRTVGTGYHGSEEPRGCFFWSLDRGVTWKGPVHFAGLSDVADLEGAELTPRTSYLANGSDDCLVFLSARSPERRGSDRTFCIRTIDGGLTFRFVSWVVPPDDPCRGVMPSVVRCSPSRLVAALRRRDMADGACWIDAYRSDDDGLTWSTASRVGSTGAHNGNPPALVRLEDGRLCCVYGNRDERRVIAAYSSDGGGTWSTHHTVRDGYSSVQDDQDFGYPRLVLRDDGRLLAMYYWACAECPQQHIAATIWNPASRG